MSFYLRMNQITTQHLANRDNDVLLSQLEQLHSDIKNSTDPVYKADQYGSLVRDIESLIKRVKEKKSG